MRKNERGSRKDWAETANKRIFKYFILKMSWKFEENVVSYSFCTVGWGDLGYFCGIFIPPISQCSSFPGLKNQIFRHFPFLWKPVKFSTIMKNRRLTLNPDKANTMINNSQKYLNKISFKLENIFLNYTKTWKNRKTFPFWVWIKNREKFHLHKTFKTDKKVETLSLLKRKVFFPAFPCVIKNSAVKSFSRLWIF